MKRKRSWIAPVLVAVLAGICYYRLSEPFPQSEAERKGVLAAHDPARGPAGEFGADSGDLHGLYGSAAGADAAGNPIAQEYASAYLENRWDDVIRLTCWMQERLERFEPGEPAAAAVEALRRRSSQRLAEGNRLRPEGIEDQYVFAGGVTVTPVGIDAGRDDLERPVKDRTWVRVTFPDRSTALRDEAGLPIRSLVAGINVSEDGFVLKANVVGNLEIDADSIQTFWRGVSKERGHGSGSLSAM